MKKKSLILLNHIIILLLLLLLTFKYIKYIINKIYSNIRKQCKIHKIY